MRRPRPWLRALIVVALFGIGGLLVLRMVGAEHVAAGVGLFLLWGALAQFTAWFLRGD